MTRLGLAIVALLIGASGASAQNPSFSCDGRLNDTEAAICDSSSLSQLDREMSAIYEGTLGQLSGRFRDSLARTQRDWLRERDRCGSDVRCIRDSYRERTTVLMVEADRPAPAEPPRQRSAEACTQIFDRVCTDVPAGSDFALRCHRRYPEIFDRIPERCHGEFQTLVENAREGLEQERRRAAPGIPHPGSDWFERSHAGFTEYRVESGPRHSFTIGCSEGGERRAGERAFIDVIINGYSADAHSDVHITVDSEVYTMRTNAAGDISTSRADSASTFRDLWTRLRYANSISVQHGTGRSARFSARGSRDTLPEEPCQTTYR